jgi:integrase
MEGSRPFRSASPSGHVFRVQRRRGAVWYAKYRLPDGRQVQRKIGPAWAERGRPPAGHYTKRQAQEWLRDVLDQARKGTLAGLVRTGVTVDEAAAEFLRYLEHDRARKPATIRGYRWLIHGHISPAFGDMRIEDVTPAMVEAWSATLSGTPASRRKIIVTTYGIFQRARKAYGLPSNPVADVEKPPLRRSGDIAVYSPEEVWALVRAADSEQDAAIYLTAAFTGLRMGELIALRWRDVDFPNHTIRVRASFAIGHLTTPKSGKVRAVPLAPDVASVLARLGQRGLATDDDDLVFLGSVGGFLDGSAMRRRYKAALARAGLRPLRFHDLRHTFGTRMIAHADIRRVQEWMGHADVQTTMQYLHYAPRDDEAELVALAFARPAGGAAAPAPERTP